MSSAAQKLEDFGTESFADELPLGTRLLQGQFTLESFLNAGGFGITYVARDSLNRQVVIKECFPSSFCRRTGQRVGARSQQRQNDFRSSVALFMQEAVNLSRLDHPNIVRVHQVFQDNDTAYMAMDYVRGPDLLETVEGTAPRLTPDRITVLLSRMLDALGHVHAQGFLHRDISPDNILLDSATGEPVLIDFGAARKDETRKSRALSGLRVVKDGYSPQEFYISGSLQGPCSDLYALAASFSHLITGEAPRTSRERLSAIANRQGDPQRPLQGRVKGYADGFLAAIDKAMAIFPRDRLQSVGEWQAMLGDVARDVSATAWPVQADPARRSGAVNTFGAQQLPPSRDRLVRAAALVLLLAGLASLAGQIYDRFLAPGRGAALSVEKTFVATDSGAGRIGLPSENPGQGGHSTIDRFAFASLTQGGLGPVLGTNALTGGSVTTDAAALDGGTGLPARGTRYQVMELSPGDLTDWITSPACQSSAATGAEVCFHANGLASRMVLGDLAPLAVPAGLAPGEQGRESAAFPILLPLSTILVRQTQPALNNLPEVEVNNTVAT